MFPSHASRAFVLIFRAATLLLICLIPQGCQDQGGSGTASSQTLSPYMKKCLDNDVPVPPDWGDFKWEQQADLDPNKVFDTGTVTYTSTQVWIYRSQKPKGICYALPRMQGTKIVLLGMICQGETGNACFWDNKQPGTSTEITPFNGMKPAEMADGSNLIENCVNCHRGDNVFAITPGTSLQQAYPPTTAAPPATAASPDSQLGRPTTVNTPPYKPITTDPPRPGWTNDPNDPTAATPGNVKLAKDGDGCEFCHSIPRLTEGYCSLAQKMVNKGLMPPPNSLKPTDPDIQGDIKALKNACNELKPGSWP